MIDIFENRKKSDDGKTHVPVWFMRQAGRYHNHYQNIKKNSDFMTMCTNPKLACEVTHGPIDDFKFDAAILFSDLLFPLQQMGLGLEYAPGPKLGKKLETLADFDGLQEVAPASEFYAFQGEACKLLRDSLANDVTLLGFVGAPFTLFSYAVEGSHAGALVKSKTGLYDGRFDRFVDILFDNLIEEMRIQAVGGAQAIALFDTAIGELTLKDFTEIVLPVIKKITKTFKAEFPDKKIIYYSKHTQLSFLRSIEDDNIDVLGVDWKHHIPSLLKEFGNDYYIQGNIDPCWLHLPWEKLQANSKEYFNEMKDSGAPLNKWICGLGHGVLQHTPEENVRNLVSMIHEELRY